MNKAIPVVREAPQRHKGGYNNNEYGYHPSSRGGKSEEKVARGHYSGSERSPESHSNKGLYDKGADGIRELRKNSEDAHHSKERLKTAENANISNGRIQADQLKHARIGDYGDIREKILMEKERKKKEEQLRLENELKNIRLENNEARRIAQEKKQLLFKPSQDNFLHSHMEPKANPEGRKGASSLAQNSDGDNKKDFSENQELKGIAGPLGVNQPQKSLKIQEEKDMYADDFESDKDNNTGIGDDEDQETDLKKLEEKINAYQERLSYNATRISDLKKSLRHTKQ